MANYDELKRLGERFPNKNVGCGNPDAKILVVTQKEGNEDIDFKYLKRLFRDFPTRKVKTSMSSHIVITLCMTRNY